VGFFFQFHVVFRIMLAYFSNHVSGLANLGESEWRWKLGMSALPATLFFLDAAWNPEKSTLSGEETKD
jgi:hypothetical protein